jgi:hypothetical protein
MGGGEEKQSSLFFSVLMNDDDAIDYTAPRKILLVLIYFWEREREVLKSVLRRPREEYCFISYLQCQWGRRVPGSVWIFFIFYFIK